MKQLKILTCVDGSEESKKAISLSGKFVNITGASLLLVHVLDDLVSYAEVPDTAIYKERKEAGLKLLKESEKLVKAEEAACTTKLVVGPVAPEIVRLAEKENINVICIGTRGKTGLKRMLVGSVADRVIRYAHCPVTVVR